jgi:hypothetical protein
MLLGILFAAGLVSATPATPAQSSPALLRVYVKTDEGGQRDELAARRESVKDMTEALTAKKKTFTVVEKEADADVVVEVLDRAVNVPKVVMGISPRPGGPVHHPRHDGAHSHSRAARAGH